jgi:hypothetical protein
MNPTARANELIDVTESLTAVIERESDLLKELRVKEIGALQQEKTSLSGLYEIRIREAVQEPELFKAVDPGTRSRLRIASEAFERYARRNANALRAALEMNTRMVNTIAKLATRQQVQPSGYGADGSRPRVARKQAHSVMPMTLNQQL